MGCTSELVEIHEREDSAVRATDDGDGEGFGSGQSVIESAGLQDGVKVEPG